MNDMFNNPRLALLVTDSGLGGLSICADIVRDLTRRRTFRDLSVVYFNA
jgi:glutamate racemase